MKNRGGIGLLILQYALLIDLCTVIISIPMPPLNKNTSLTYSDLLSAITFISIGFYLGHIWNLKKLASLKKELKWSSLSVREQEVAQLILAKKSNQEIGDILFIEINTVKSHLKSIYKKTDCNGRANFRKHFD